MTPQQVDKLIGLLDEQNELLGKRSRELAGHSYASDSSLLRGFPGKQPSFEDFAIGYEVCLLECSRYLSHSTIEAGETDFAKRLSAFLEQLYKFQLIFDQVGKQFAKEGA